MTREEKISIVEGLSEKIANNGSLYITDASGLTVEQTNALRKLCFDAGIEYGVYKNTLIRKAFEKKGIKSEELFKVLRGFSGIMFAKEPSSAPAKMIKKYRKVVEGKPVLKMASIDSELYFGDENLNTLSKLKSRDELIADVVHILQSPVRNLVSAVLSGQHKISGIVKALQEKTK